uniref:Uncharacterized protein n=1 Tax=Macrostomum lignano TaxID=282301 RepID=A0A1I8G5A0_9PLAT
MDNQGAAAAVADQEDLTKKFCKKSAADSANQSSSDSREMSAKKVDYTALERPTLHQHRLRRLGRPSPRLPSFPDGFAAIAAPTSTSTSTSAWPSWCQLERPERSSKATTSNCSRLTTTTTVWRRRADGAKCRVLRPVSTQQQFDDRHNNQTGCHPIGGACAELSAAAAVFGHLREYNLRDCWTSSRLTVGSCTSPRASAFLADHLGLYPFPSSVYLLAHRARSPWAPWPLLIGSLVRKNLPAVAIR